MGLTEFLLVVAVGGGIIAVLYATFRGAAEEAAVERGPVAAGGDRPAREIAELEEKRRAVERALEEIDVDHAAGNLADADYEEMRRRYEKEAALLDDRLREERRRVGAPAEARWPVEAPQAAPGGPSRLPAALAWGGGILGFLVLAWLVMSTALRPRGADDTITGSLPGQGLGGGAAGPAIADVDMDRLRALEAIVAEDSSNVEALNELGHLYLTMQRYGEVITLSTKALQLDPDSPEALTHMGMILVTVDHVEEGMASFDRALAADPEFAEALLFKGMIAFRRQNFATAADAWERYLEVAPPDANLERIRGMLQAARQSAGSGPP